MEAYPPTPNLQYVIPQNQIRVVTVAVVHRLLHFPLINVFI